MKRCVYLLLLQWINPTLVFGQGSFRYQQAPLQFCPLAASVSPKDITREFRPNLIHLEMPSPGGNSYHAFLQTQKQQLTSLAPKTGGGTVILGEADSPLILEGFPGNPFDGSVPTDNHLAISNSGMLVSVANSTLFFYDTENSITLDTIALEDFFDTLGLPANKYDPRVLYDPKADRFIVVCLSGSEDSTSHIVLAFSQTSNPVGIWNMYKLEGNPLGNSTWSDFPMVAITDEELFITVNLLANDTINTPDSWKYLFQQSVIWQINKRNGYDGQPLQNRFYHDIQYNNAPVRNLCPIQGATTTAGPNIYLLSNRNFAIQNDTFFILEITNLLHHPQTQLTLRISTADIPYGLPPDGKERSNRILLTNDARVLDGFIENQKIHFVQNTRNPDTMRAAIYHGVISNLSMGTGPVIRGAVIGSESLDFAYPAISFSGQSPADEEAIITFNHTSVDSFAGVSAVFYNGTGYSERVTLKAGEDFVAILPGLRQRWGDYSGSQRKYNEPGKVWISGFYGIRLGTGLNQVRTNATWIAALASPDTLNTFMAQVKKHRYAVTTYPIPFEKDFSVEFELPEAKVLDISLYNDEGRLIKTFIRDKVNSGKNKFSFSPQPLSAGTYFLQIRDNSRIILSEKIIKL
ncbi:MAG: hypothetical protein KatS3mg031_2233 [Chitinophagales bacterium]|nr:MAG: hypothetical protein KatS3mg031_2233 [Chitinophagales bacterium]